MHRHSVVTLILVRYDERMQRTCSTKKKKKGKGNVEIAASVENYKA